MDAAKKTFDLYTQLGILTDCKSLATVSAGDTWEIWGHFQNANGRKNARVAQFDDVGDAVEFRRLWLARVR